MGTRTNEGLCAGRALRGVALAALAGALFGCATTQDRVTRPARSARGRMGFGVASTTQAQLGGSVSAFRTGIAGASAPGVEPGGGDFVWRVTSAGTSLELCHAGWAARPCRTALFDGAPNTLAPMLKFSLYPVLIDPVNLGRVGIVNRDGQGNVYVYSSISLDLKKSTVPTTAGYGVWALGGESTLHHCQLEGETPRCRAAKLPDGSAVFGLPISVHTYGTETREGVWFVGGARAGAPESKAPVGLLFADTVMHCEAKSGAMEAPSCRVAKLDGGPLKVAPVSLLGLAGAAPEGTRRVAALASHAIADGAAHRHVLWMQSDMDIVRCQAATGETPGCARAQIK